MTRAKARQMVRDLMESKGYDETLKMISNLMGAMQKEEAVWFIEAVMEWDRDHSEEVR